MSREKGSEKTGGRKRGTPNKSTAIVREYLESIDFHVPEEIIKRLPLLDEKKQVDVLLKLMEFTFPKYKTIAHEHKGFMSITDWLHASEEED